jgi:hypothetical protein
VENSSGPIKRYVFLQLKESPVSLGRQDHVLVPGQLYFKAFTSLEQFILRFLTVIPTMIFLFVEVTSVPLLAVL